MSRGAAFVQVALWLATGVIAWGHGDLHEQIEQVTIQIGKEPAAAELFLKRGELHRAHGDNRAAVADYDRVAALAPKFAAVDLARGKLLLGSGAYRSARTALDRFLAVEPHWVDALVTRGRVLRHLNEHLAATADFTEAIRQSPRPEPEYYLERAQALTAAGVAHHNDALEGLKEGLLRLGNPITLVLATLDLEMAQARYDDALARIDRVMSTLPRKAPWLERRGDICLKAGREKEAHRAFTEALAEINQIPAHRRGTAASLDLEKRLHAKLYGANPPGDGEQASSTP